MKRKDLCNKLMLGAAILAASTFFSSCESDGSSTDENEKVYQAVLSEYVNTTVVPTYKALAEAALEMRAANIALKANQTNATMKAASDAWMKARVQWEMSEAFLFGPVGETAFDIDGHIDSWPLELDKINQTMEEVGTNLKGKQAYQMDAEVIGFHVTEYLLYRNGQSRLAAELTPAELGYLTAATDALVWDCVLAYAAWIGENGLSTEMKNVLNENNEVSDRLKEMPQYNGYGSKLIVGQTGTGTSISGAFQEIASGAQGIAEEVGVTKIEAPYRSGSVEDVESWYSWHSLDDYQNNIRSIKNAYLGGRDDASRKTNCLSMFVKSKNPALDTNIKNKIEECLTKIAAIGTGGTSFYQVVKAKKEGSSAKDAVVDAAVTACTELAALFAQVNSMVE